MLVRREEGLALPTLIAIASLVPSHRSVACAPPFRPNSYNVFGFQLHVALLQHAVLSYFVDEGNAACNVWVVTAAKILSLVTSNFPQLILIHTRSGTLVVCQYE